MSDTRYLEARYLEGAKKVLTIEAEAILHQKKQINANFLAICQAIREISGRVIVMGMGKSGHIGRKISATFASTGTPSFFVHPAEASHGDLGMVTKEDLVLLLSNSGETDELLEILPVLSRQAIPLIALTGDESSSLARLSNYHLFIDIKEEACPLGLAPTASSTAVLAMGDALAITLLEMRGFTREDFAFSHPGGKLGRRLLLRVADSMESLENCAVLPKEALLSEVLIEMTKNPVGIALCVSEDHTLLGLFSEGDLRRVLVRGETPQTLTLAECMTKTPVTISHEALAVDAVTLMENRKITALPVLNNQQKVIGVINMHHLLKARVI